jgi:hypothetical protein
MCQSLNRYFSVACEKGWQLVSAKQRFDPAEIADCGKIASPASSPR